MREQVLALADQPTKGEALEAIEAVLGRQEAAHSPTAETIVADVGAERR